MRSLFWKRICLRQTHGGHFQTWCFTSGLWNALPSTVLAQDHFYSDFCSLPSTFQTLVSIHEDEYTSALLGRHLVTTSWWAANALVDWMDYQPASAVAFDLTFEHPRCVKRTVVISKPDASPRPWHLLSLFQPKTATIQHIAIALVKIYLIAG